MKNAQPKISRELIAAVDAAKQAAQAKGHELAAAEEMVKRLEQEVRAADVAVRQAQEKADALLPQCRVVRIPWRRAKEEEGTRVAIVRQTPSGTLVVRSVGDANGLERKFKWSPHRELYRAVERAHSYICDSVELRDVPPEYMPAESAEQVKPGSGN